MSSIETVDRVKDALQGPIAAGLNMGGSYQQSRVATTADTATVPTNTAGRDVTYRVAGEHEREGMVEKAKISIYHNECLHNFT
jgi:hypothetical protein